MKTSNHVEQFQTTIELPEPSNNLEQFQTYSAALLREMKKETNEKSESFIGAYRSMRYQPFRNGADLLARAYYH